MRHGEGAPGLRSLELERVSPGLRGEVLLEPAAREGVALDAVQVHHLQQADPPVHPLHLNVLLQIEPPGELARGDESADELPGLAPYVSSDGTRATRRLLPLCHWPVDMACTNRSLAPEWFLP